MPVEVTRKHYPNGQLHVETSYDEQAHEGTQRIWHDNGVLATEYPLCHRLISGTIRQWDRQGKLLGSFELVNGSGKFKLWYDGGALLAEADVFLGQRMGRAQTWDEAGKLEKEEYYLDGRQVTSREYHRFASLGNRHPQYEFFDDSDSDGVEQPIPDLRPEVFLRTKPPTAEQRKEAEEHDSFCTGLLASGPVAEAREWFAKRPKRSMRTLGELQTTAESKKEIDALYRAGAVNVTLVEIDHYEEVNGQNTGKLVITMAKDPLARAKVLAWAARWARARGFEPYTDVGQKYVFVMMD